MKLIADSGGTKVEWALVDAGKVVKQIFTSGINTLILTEEEISQYIDDELILQLGDLARNVTEVYFYGAGCVDDDVCRTVRRAIRANIPVDAVEAHSDLLGAARAISDAKAALPAYSAPGPTRGTTTELSSRTISARWDTYSATKGAEPCSDAISSATCSSISCRANCATN